jgi:hypothetical protein
MGNRQSSKNYLDNVTETITRVIQENAQQCQVNSSQVQQLVASGNCSITLKNVTFDQLTAVNFECIQSAELNAKIASTMNVELEQLAKSLLSGLRFDIASSQDAQNFITNHVRLVTEVINRMTQSCGVNAGQAQLLECKDNSSILVTDTSFKQVIQSLFKCTQQGETVADITTSIEQFIKQSAIAENKGLSFDLLLIAGVIVVVVVLIMIINKGLDWKFLAIGLPILLIIIYFIMAVKKNWWPFKSKFDDKAPKPPAAIPLPPPPIAVQKQAARNMEMAWNRTLLGIPKQKLTPEQYRRLKYGDDSIAFERPYGQRRKCYMENKLSK